MPYSEEKELVRYLLRNYSHLLSPEERDSLEATLGGRPDPDSSMLRVVDGPSGVHVDALEVCERLLEARRGVIVIARCPRCKRIVETVHDRQCRWCDFGWSGF